MVGQLTLILECEGSIPTGYSNFRQLFLIYITESIDAVNILPLARFEPTTSATPPSTTQDTDATNVPLRHPQ